MQGLIAQYGVLMAVLIIFAGEIGIPTLIPGEIAILIVGSQLRDPAQLVGALLVFGTVDVMACSSIHVAARTTGNRLLVRLLRFVQPGAACHEEIVERWRGRLGGRDAAVVFVTRLIPIARLYASITTGLIRIRIRDFVFGAVPASFLWASIPLTLGFLSRSKIQSLESQYPQAIHLVMFASVTMMVLLGTAVWAHQAGSRRATLRRYRVAFGFATVGGAVVRLFLIALYGDRALTNLFPVPSASVLSAWVTVFSGVALCLLWIAAHDLEVVRGRLHRPHGIGLSSGVAWVTLMTLFCALNTIAGGHQVVSTFASL